MKRIVVLWHDYEQGDDHQDPDDERAQNVRLEDILAGVTKLRLNRKIIVKS